MWSKAESIYRIATHSTAKAWRNRLARYRLVGTHCPACGMDHFPGRHVCPKCHSRDLEAKEFSRGETSFVPLSIIRRSWDMLKRYQRLLL